MFKWLFAAIVLLFAVTEASAQRNRGIDIQICIPPFCGGGGGGGWGPRPWGPRPWGPRPYYPPQPYYNDYNQQVQYCMQRFRSYDPRSGVYMGYDGRYHRCP